MDDAAAKHHQISISDVTAALKSPRSILAGTSILEYLNTTDFPTTSLKPWSAFPHHLHLPLSPHPYPPLHHHHHSPLPPNSPPLCPHSLPLQPSPLLSPSPTLPQQTTPPKLFDQEC